MFGWLALFLAAGPLRAVERTQIFVDRRDLSVRLNGKPVASVRMKPPAELTAHFRFDKGAPRTAERFQFMLEGRDSEWQEIPSDMRLAIAFYDQRNEWLTETNFPIVGASPGWTGSVETSPMVARSEQIPVPPGAVKFCLFISSAGAPDNLGAVAIGGLRVSGVEAPSPAHLLVLDLPADGRTPPAWIRSGDRPGMTSIVSGTVPGGLLVIRDVDLEHHAEWRCNRIELPLIASQRLQIDWLQCFSASRGGDHQKHWGGLAPGHYLLRYRKLTPEGLLAAPERSIAVIVPYPVWQRGWFLVLSCLATAGAAFGLMRFVWWRRAQRELAALRQQHALETERARIARDIHDDLGSSLTHICMLSERPDSAQTAEMAESLDRINHAAREMTRGMDEIVWALNPRNDQLDHLVTFLDSHAQEFLNSAGIESTCEYPEEMSPLPVASAKRHNLFLAFKEALTNAARHSGCRSVRIRIEARDALLSVSVADDGRGFANPEADGDGLNNMRRRMEDLGGRCQIESEPGGGTKVSFEVPL